MQRCFRLQTYGSQNFSEENFGKKVKLFLCEKIQSYAEDGGVYSTADDGLKTEGTDETFQQFGKS